MSQAAVGCARWLTPTLFNREICYEKNFSSQCPQAQTHSRFSGADGHKGRSPGVEPAPGKGQKTPFRLGRQASRLGEQAAGSRFDKSKRLLDAKDYSRVFNQPDARASHQHLLLLGKRNARHAHRLGLVISKKNVRLAVQRNRLKRVAREFFRTLSTTEPALDVVLLARRGIDKLDNAELSSILQHQWQRLVRLSVNSETNSRQDS